MVRRGLASAASTAWMPKMRVSSWPSAPPRRCCGPEGPRGSPRWRGCRICGSLTWVLSEGYRAQLAGRSMAVGVTDGLRLLSDTPGFGGIDFWRGDHHNHHALPLPATAG